VFPTATNLVDAAVARPIDQGDILDESLEIGSVNEETSPELGMAVCKSGRTTGYTTGTISVIDATVMINYSSDLPATYEEQIITTPMSNGGDSGSLLVAKDTSQAVGLLFAGSSQTTIHNSIKNVFSSLNVDLKDPKKPTRTDVQGEIEKAQSVKRAYQDMLLSKPNVVGLGVGLCHKEGRRTDQVGLIVMVRRKVPKTILAIEDMIPEEIDGVPVDVKEVGSFEVLKSSRA